MSLTDLITQILNVNVPAITALALAYLGASIYKIFRCPPGLRHLPRVPLLPTLLSLLRGETEFDRVNRLLLPYATMQSEDLVVVWAFGTWYVHVVGAQLGKELMENRHVQKALPGGPDMLFWRFVGQKSIFMIDGEQWKKHAAIMRPVITRRIPMDIFWSLSQRLIEIMGKGGRLHWNELAHRITLDAVGKTVIGYDFKALENPDGKLVKLYRSILADVSHPLYVAFPALERLLPRRNLISRIDWFNGMLGQIFEEKRKEPAEDFLSYILDSEHLSEEECRDGVVAMFMAGHDTTAGALSSIVYNFAKHPACQHRARQEVLEILKDEVEPTIDDFSKMPFLQACIHESMRMNNPSTVTMPRVASVDTKLGKYVIPAGVPVLWNMSGALHNERDWPDEAIFNPNRFLDEDAEKSLEKWIPFGAGPRRCPGKNFSLYEQRVIVAALLRSYSWELPEKTIHKERLRNAFSAFALNLPYELDIVFTKLS
ncbi:hypothetical protein AMATHDRAFT_151389 [Amanita thiersii Skay4041]|uniref:Cytochrome P450 n=1 Tax=Amanita thiersii Skay4041 TaxID=703135 RepID=A0A2A9NHM0_9AGAR|nr:hypothetical protein AMATHDRAFT_151389 [Amanita thiersii Skay4041]